MAIEGVLFLQTNDRNKANEIAKYIWSLNFKKDIRVDVSVYESEEYISTLVSRARYLVNVNPKVELTEIKDFLLKKGYITE